MFISLVEWSKINNIDPATARQRAGRGSFKTAKKIGRNWVIDEDEKLLDNRRRSETVFMAKGTIKAIQFSILNGIEFSLEEGFKYNLYSVKPENIHFGGKNCEIGRLVVGSKILFNPANVFTELTILSDGVREVDEEGNLIKW